MYCNSLNTFHNFCSWLLRQSVSSRSFLCSVFYHILAGLKKTEKYLVYLFYFAVVDVTFRILEKIVETNLRQEGLSKKLHKFGFLLSFPKFTGHKILLRYKLFLALASPCIQALASSLWAVIGGSGNACISQHIIQIGLHKTNHNVQHGVSIGKYFEKPYSDDLPSQYTGAIWVKLKRFLLR